MLELVEHDHTAAFLLESQVVGQGLLVGRGVDELLLDRPQPAHRLLLRGDEERVGVGLRREQHAFTEAVGLAPIDGDVVESRDDLLAELRWIGLPNVEEARGA